MDRGEQSARRTAPSCWPWLSASVSSQAWHSAVYQSRPCRVSGQNRWVPTELA